MRFGSGWISASGTSRRVRRAGLEGQGAAGSSWGGGSGRGKGFDEWGEVVADALDFHGATFWFSRKKFVGSYARLSAWSRSYFAAP